MTVADDEEVEVLDIAPGALITRDGQIEWDGVLLGSGTPYRWVELVGWEDLPALDSGNVPRPQRHGAWPGRYLAQERVITWTARIVAEPGGFGAAVTAVRAALRIGADDTEQPLVIRTKDGETLLAYAAVTSRVIPNTPAAGIGRGTLAVMWVASDPRRYSLDQHAETIPQPQAGTGLQYPLTYPLDYGAVAETGDRTLTNAGSEPAPLRLVISGPVTTPALALNGSVLEFDLTLTADEQLVVDTGAGTVLLSGTDRTYTLTDRSTPLESFELPPGDSIVSFRAGAFGGGSTCDVTWRDAWM